MAAPSPSKPGVFRFSKSDTGNTMVFVNDRDGSLRGIFSLKPGTEDDAQRLLLALAELGYEDQAQDAA